MDKSKKEEVEIKATGYSVGVAAEAFTAACFARLGYYVSVQYGANQPGYDLVIDKGHQMLKVNSKGSKDGSWVINASFKKNKTYLQAAEAWRQAQFQDVVFCFVQFEGVSDDHLPRMYLANRNDVAERLQAQANGHGDTSLFENKKWKNKNARGKDTTDKIPDKWQFSKKRIEEMLSDVNG